MIPALTVPETEGWHYLIISVNDTYGLVNTIVIEIYVDITLPVITLQNTENDTSIENILVIDLEVTDYSLDSVWYSWDGLANQTLIHPYEVDVPSTEGYHWLAVYANDSVGHLTLQKYHWFILTPSTTTTPPSNTTEISVVPTNTTPITSTQTDSSTPAISSGFSIWMLMAPFIFYIYKRRKD